LGLPQAPLYSADDDVVTMTTIHRAKGLEWPVVFLMDVGGRLNSKTVNSYWSDPRGGPLLAPSENERGMRARAIAARYDLEQMAEEARLLYVAATRARDRLVVMNSAANDRCYLTWLMRGKD